MNDIYCVSAYPTPHTNMLRSCRRIRPGLFLKSHLCMGRSGSRYQRPVAAQVGPSSGFSLIMHRLVSRLVRTVESNGICNEDSHAWGGRRVILKRSQLHRAWGGKKSCTQEELTTIYTYTLKKVYIYPIPGRRCACTAS